MNNIIKKIGAIVILGISIFSFIGCNSSSEKPLNIDNTTETKVKLDRSNPITINYNDDNYSETSDMIAHNKLNAEEKYLNKTIKITGEVSKVKTENDKIIVVITSPNKLGAVYLEFNSSYKDKLLNLNLYNERTKQDGDIITVYGYGSRFDNVCLVLSDCEFE